MDVPEEVLQQLGAIKSALDDLDTHMQPFLEAGPKQITAQLTPLERVRTHLALAQAAVVLGQLTARLDAAKLAEGHPLHKEAERLANYEKKVRKAISDDELARTKPGTSLNIAAANRFIDAAIPDLSTEQKAALRWLNKREAAAGEDGSSAAVGSNAGSSRVNQAGRRQQQQEQQQQAQEQEQQRPGRQKKAKKAGAAASAGAFLAEVMEGVEQQEREAAAQQQQQQQQEQQEQQEQQQQQQGDAEADGAEEFMRDVLGDV